MAQALFELICERGPDTGRRYPLNKAETVIGRDPGCDIALQDEFASRRHAKVVVDKDGHMLVNMSSVGTTLNGKPADKNTLANGDIFELGPYSRLRYQKVESQTAPALAKVSRPSGALAPVGAGAGAGSKAGGVPAKPAAPASGAVAPVTPAAPAVPVNPVSPSAPTAVIPRGQVAGVVASAAAARSKETGRKRTKMLIGAGAYFVALVVLFVFLSTLKRRGQAPPPILLLSGDIDQMLKKADVPLPATAEEASEWRAKALKLYSNRGQRVEDLHRIYAWLRGVEEKGQLNNDEKNAMDDARSRLTEHLYKVYKQAYISDRAGNTSKALREYLELRIMIPNHRLELYQIAVARERILSEK